VQKHGSHRKQAAVLVAGKPKSSWTVLPTLSTWVRWQTMPCGTSHLCNSALPTVCLSVHSHSGLWVHVGLSCLLPHGAGLIRHDPASSNSMPWVRRGTGPEDREEWIRRKQINKRGILLF
jgi:hypothetical protein